MKCAVLGKDYGVNPLTQTEYNALVRGLVKVNLRPADLLQKDNIPGVAKESGLDQQRLEMLLGRGVQMGFALEEWQRSGVWVLSRSDADYPVRLKNHLKDKAPPLLFGVGEQSLLSGGGVAIVGSRNVDADGEAFTRKTAEICAMADYGLVVQCEYQKGGTWTGAAEELKRVTARPVFVRASKAKGNCKLLELGAISWPDKPSSTALSKQLLDLAQGKKQKQSFEKVDLFDYPLIAKEEGAAFKSEKLRILNIFYPRPDSRCILL